MRLTTLVFALASLVAGLELVSATGLALHRPRGSQQHEDARLGFRVRVPQGWARIPLQVEERWIVAKYLSDKRYEYPDNASGFDKYNRPHMLVIALPKDGRYKDYKAYLKGTYRRAGYYVEDETTVAAGDFEATVFDVRVREGDVDNYDDMAPRRIMTRVHDLEDVLVAVHFEAKEADVYAKLEKELSRCLASFKRIPVKDESFERCELPGRAELDALEDRQRNRLLQNSEAELHARARIDLPRGWKAKRTDRFLVLDHADAGYAKKLVQQGEAVFAWLDENFAMVRPGRYVRAPILRVCSEWDEAQAIAQCGGFDDDTGVGLDIVTYRSEFGAQGASFDRVSMRVKEIWFSEKDPALYAALPSWIRSGVTDMLADSRAKRKKLVFKEDDWDLEGLRESIRKGEMPPLRRFLKMSSEEFRDLDTGYEQAGVVMQFLMSKTAARDKRTKDLVGKYVRNLIDVVAGVDEEEARREAAEKEPETEAEEDAIYRKRRERRKANERRILDETFERTFGAWTDRDWRAVEKALMGSF